jgi:hypothetical protein
VQHGGSVEARTLAEGGAEFVVCLPGQSTAAATAVPVSA